MLGPVIQAKLSSVIADRFLTLDIQVFTLHMVREADGGGVLLGDLLARNNLGLSHMLEEGFIKAHIVDLSPFLA